MKQIVSIAGSNSLISADQQEALIQLILMSSLIVIWLTLRGLRPRRCTNDAYIPPNDGTERGSYVISRLSNRKTYLIRFAYSFLTLGES